MQIISTKRYNLTPVTITFNKNPTSVCKYEKNREDLNTSDEHINWWSDYGKWHGGSSKFKNRITI